MARTVVLRKRWHPRRGVFASSLGVPLELSGSYEKGQLFSVCQTMDGSLLFTPVKAGLQPPVAG